MSHQAQSRQAQARRPRRARHDDVDHYAHPAPRGRPHRLPHAKLRGRTRPGRHLCRHWRSQRADPRAEGGHRAAPDQPRAVRSGRYQGPQGCPPVRTPRHRQDPPGPCPGLQHQRHLPQGCGLRHRRQVHRRIRPGHPRDVRLRQGPSALRHLHGRDRCHRWQSLLRGNQRRSRDPAHPHGAAQPDGRLRGAGAGQDGHGDEPSRHFGSRPPPSRSVGSQDRNSGAQRNAAVGDPQDPFELHHQARQHRF
mmetsp:Transcript_21534/g.61738  ORF Transcript_21534/g.61738 Transcript_21534/m.61738 type:complete len:250 (+) Transcript_21534:494-1243(+)